MLPIIGNVCAYEYFNNLFMLDIYSILFYLTLKEGSQCNLCLGLSEGGLSPVQGTGSKCPLRNSP